MAAPTVTNISAAEGFHGALNLIDIVVSSTLPVTVTLSLPPEAGALAPLPTGVVITGPGVYEFTGSSTAVNSFLKALTYTPANGYYDTFTLNVSVQNADGILEGSKTLSWNLAATDNLQLGTGDNQFLFKAVSGAQVDAQGGNDTLLLAGSTAAKIDLNATSDQVLIGSTAHHYKGFENFNAENATGALTVTANSAGSEIVTGSGADTINLGVGADTVDTQAGNDTVDGSGSNLSDNDNINLGAGNDTLKLSSGNALAIVDAGAGLDTIVYKGGAATFDLNVGAASNLENEAATLSNFENLSAETVTGSLTVTVGNSSTSIKTGSGADHIVYADAAAAVAAGTGADTLVLDADNVAATNAKTINLSATTNQITIGAKTGSSWTGFENLDASNWDKALTVTASASGSDIKTGSGADAITLGIGNDTVDTGAGSDSLKNTVSGNAAVGSGDVIHLGAGDDSANYFADTLGIVDGGADTDTLSVASKTALTLNLTNDTKYTNFENISAATATGALNITAATGTSSIITGAGNDTINVAAALQAVSINAGAGNNTITGSSFNDTVALGTGIDIVNAGNGNDTVTGTLTAGDNINLGNGDDSISYSTANATVVGGDGTDTLIISGATSLTLDLSSNLSNAGNFSGFENINGSSATGNIVITAAGDTTNLSTGSGSDFINASQADQSVAINAGAGTNRVTGSNFGDTITLGSGVDTVYAGGGADTIVGTASSGDKIYLEAGNDTISYSALPSSTTVVDGGTGIDTLNYSGTTAKTINFGVTSDNIATETGAYKNFENLDAHISIAALRVTAAADTTSLITGSGNDTIDASGAAQGVSINAGNGINTVTGSAFSDTITLGSGKDIINTGDGDDTVIGSLGTDDVLNLGSGNDNFAYQAGLAGSVDGGTGGSDTLTIAANQGSVTLNLNVAAGAGRYSGFENVAAANANGALTITAATSGGTIDTGSAADTVNLGAGTDIVNAGDGADTVNGTLGADDVVDLDAGDDSFAYQTGLLGNVKGGAGSDTLVIGAGTGAITLDLNASAAIGNHSGFENVSAAAANDTLTITAATTGGTINTGSAADTVNLGAGTDILNTGDGSDTVTGTLDADDVVDLDAGNDSFAYQASLLGSVEGGDGSDTITIAIDSGAITLDLSTSAGAGHYSGFENVAAADANDTLTITAAAAGGTINTGSATDTINLGAGTDIVNTGDGADTVNGTLDADDVVDLDAGEDSFAYQAGLLGSIKGGSGEDTITLGAGTGAVTLNLAASAGAGNYSGFENLSAAAADGALHVTASNSGGTIDTGSAADTVNLGTGIDIVNTGDGADTVNGTLGADDVVDLDAGDDSFAYQAGLLGNVKGGAGSDTLVIGAGTGAITLDLNANAATGNYSGFENVSAAAADSALTITAATAGGTINTGSAADTVNLGAGTDIVNTGDGDNTVTTDLQGIDTIIGGADIDSLNITTNGTVTLSAATISVSDFENLNLSNNTNLTIDAELFKQFTSIDGGSDSTVTINGSLTDTNLSDKDFAGITTLTLSDNDDNVSISGSLSGVDTLDGGAGRDTLTFSAGSSATVTVPNGLLNFEVIDAHLVSGDLSITTSAGIESVISGTGNDTIDASAATGPVSITSGNGADIITTASGDDTIDVGSDNNSDTVHAGAGSDTVNNIGTEDLIYLEDGNDSAVYIAGATLDGGNGVDTINDTNALLTSATTITLGSVSNVGNYSNFENLDAHAATGNLTVSFDNAATGISTGLGDDTVTYNKNAVDVTVNAGNGLDTLVVSAATTAPTILADFGSSEDQIAGAGIYRNFENFDSTNYTGVVNFFGGAGTTTVKTGSGNDNLDLSDANQGVAIDAGNGNNIITGSGFGDTIELGNNEDAIYAGDGNDSISGTLSTNDQIRLEAGNDTFAYQALNDASMLVDGGDGSDTITIGSSGGPSVIDFSATGNNVASETGKFANFENLVSAADSSNNYTITASTGTTTIKTGAGNDIIKVNDAQLSDALTIAGRDGSDILEITDAATIVDADFTLISGVETLKLTDAAQNVTLATLASDTSLTTVDAAALTIGHALTLNAAAFTLGLTVNTGAGNDVITLGAGGSIVDAGDGNNVVTVGKATDDITSGAGDDLVHIGSVITFTGSLDAGSGSTDELAIDTAGTDIHTASITGFETLALASGTDVYLKTEQLLGFTNINGDAGVAAEAIALSGTNVTLDVRTVTFTDIASLTLTSGADTLTVGNNVLDNVALINAGDSSDDRLILGDSVTDVTTVDLSATSAQVDGHAANVKGFENLDASAYNSGLTVTGSVDTTFVKTGNGSDTLNLSAATGNLTVNAGNGSNIVTTGSGDDTVTLGTGADTVSTGNGSDTIIGTLTAGDSISLQGGSDTFTLQLVAGATVDAGSNADTLYVGSLGSGGQININLDATMVDQVSGNGTYTGFENLDGSASSRSLSVVAGQFTTDITTGSRTDLIDASAASTGVNITAGDGNDLISGSDLADTIHADAGSDTIIAGGGSDLIWGGDGADTFIFADGFGDDVINDFSLSQDTLDISSLEGLTGYDHYEVSGDANSATIIAYDAGHASLGSITLLGVSETDASSHWAYPTA